MIFKLVGERQSFLAQTRSFLTLSMQRVGLRGWAVFGDTKAMVNRALLLGSVVSSVLVTLWMCGRFLTMPMEQLIDRQEKFEKGENSLS
ncbi:hypothetical protein THII_1498 [Thioploca ingrica]|uniref:Uncharacterized protein n=1 Tax=Thioploca ingrica TaxID=40754 RepID=A0A090AL51_9GAMM|nr:hypothetical protein THII_1498 [Thioploca ingrica]